MKKILMLALSLTLIASCSKGGKYSDVKEVLQKITKASEDFSSAVKKADSAKDNKAMAQAIKDYTSTSKDLFKDMKAMQAKYPELGKNKKDVPQELKAEVDKMSKSMMSIFSAMSTVQKYSKDPEVKKAMMELTKLKM